MSATLPAPAGFTASNLVFSDNFSGGSLNASSWNTYMASSQYGVWFPNVSGGSALARPGSYNSEYDMPSQVSVNNGLTLTAVRQSITTANGTYPVTSGVVTTYGNMEFDGGYLQISMKEPGGDGSWPSLWMLPGKSAGNASDNFEIDIQEGGMTDGSANPNDVLAYHLHNWGGGGTFGGVVNTGVDLTAGYNTYAINWVPGKSITWYLNGQAVAEITSAQAPIPNEPMELIMSNEVASSSASGWHTTLDSSTPQSMPMQIGDVQLYQAPGNGETVTGSNATGSPTPPTPPTVADLLDPSNASYDAGFTVTTGAAVTVTVNGSQLTSAGLLADFAKTTSGGLDTYTAQPGAFTGAETIAASATLTDAAGNVSSPGMLTLKPIDTTPPAAPAVANLLDPSNASYDAGFTVTTGAAVTVTVNGSQLTSAGLLADFAKTTSGGLDTYTAQPGAFTGAETIAASATLTDAAGNVSSPGMLTLKPIDTTPPAAPAVANLLDPSNASYDAGFTVTTGAAVTVTVNGSQLTSAGLLADFAKTTSGGLDTYTAQPGAFTGAETIAASATLTDAAGNVSSPGMLTLKPIDTPPPAAPAVANLLDPSNASYDAGFTVTTGAAVRVTVNGSQLTSAQLLADFAKTTSGLDTYTAQPNAFTGAESIAVSATLTDPAGNVSAPGTLTLKPIDTTPPASPTVADLLDPSNASYDAGFTVTTGAAVTVTVNGSQLTSAQLLADFAKTTSGGLDTYTAQPGAFTGAETIAASATLTDPAGNVSSPGMLTLKPIGTPPPAAPAVANLLDPSNASYDAGFTVTTGAAVRVTVNGSQLTSAGLLADFAKTTSGLDTYTAQPNAFTGAESIAVSATLTDPAGNVSAPGTLTLKPIDTTPPTQPAITSASYVGSGTSAHWSLGGTAEAGSTVTVYDGVTQLVPPIPVTGGSWSYPSNTTLKNNAVHDFIVTATDTAGNTSVPSAAYFEGTPGNDTFNFASEAALSAATLINGGPGTDAVQMTSSVTLTDADFAHLQSIEVLSLTGVSSVTLGTKALADRLGTVITGGGTLNASLDTGSLSVTATGTNAHTIQTGSGKDSITATHGGDTIQGGGGGDTINVLGHSGADTFVYAATSDSLNRRAGDDVITGFVTGSDVLNFHLLNNPSLHIQGPLSGNIVAADTITWQYSGGSAMVYVNDTTGSLNTNSNNGNFMEITLNGVSSGLSANNFKV